ncbi:MAG: hypothetical protein ISR58_00325 [Anaerolineales bacterium]|nr:hypothetical protein [Chloroflexota bacterium]MBL6979608.1 hypothetical protein [Anaerolineales bacterium]
MRTYLLVFLALLLSACKAECPPERISYLDDPALFTQITSAADLEADSSPTWIEIKGKETQVDRVITGPVCNDTWSGTVYVTCDIQIAAWETEAFFFQDCNLDIDDGAVVYVEAHNDKAYYEGCSCHK